MLFSVGDIADEKMRLTPEEEALGTAFDGSQEQRDYDRSSNSKIFSTSKPKVSIYVLRILTKSDLLREEPRKLGI